MITITPYAVARLSLLIAEEPDADDLGIRLVPTTTGCGSFTYSIAITEAQSRDETWNCSGIRLFYQPADLDMLMGIVIDCDPQTGRFSITHPRQLSSGCSLTH